MPLPKLYLLLSLSLFSINPKIHLLPKITVPYFTPCNSTILFKQITDMSTCFVPGTIYTRVYMCIYQSIFDISQ